MMKTQTKKTPAKSRKSTKSTRSVKDLKQVDGKLDTVTEKPRSLEQLMGIKYMGPYKTLDGAEYESYLADLNNTDLQSHALKVGLLPNVEARILKKRLLDEHRKFCRMRRPIRVEDQSQVSGMNQLDKRAQQILREGA